MKKKSARKPVKKLVSKTRLKHKSKFSLRGLLGLALALVFAGGYLLYRSLLVTPEVNVITPATPVTAKLEPTSTVITAVGQNLPLRVRLDPAGTHVAIASMELSYDPAKLEYVKTDLATLLPVKIITPNAKERWSRYLCSR